MIKNYRAILRSNIRALPIQGSRVMVRPENIQKLVISDLRQIKLDFHHFGVSALVGANILIRRMIFSSTCIPDAGGQDTFYVAKTFLYSPKTACAERSLLRLHANTMRPLHYLRNQMLAHIRCL